MTDQSEPKGKGRRGAHFTRAHQRMAQSHRTHESLSEAGRRGYQVTVERHGPDLAFEAARQYRLDHPSYPEMVMEGVLKYLGVPYEREWRIDEKRQLTADFKLLDSNRVIEVNSSLHNTEQQRQRDQIKQALLKKRGIPCLVVEESALRDERQSSAVVEQIKQFVQGREQVPPQTPQLSTERRPARTRSIGMGR